VIRFCRRWPSARDLGGEMRLLLKSLVGDCGWSLSTSEWFC